MQTQQAIARFPTACAALWLLVAATGAAAQVRVGIVLSSSGPNAPVGTAQRGAVELLPRRSGTLQIDYVVVDDSSNADRTVARIKSLDTDRVDAIIGPATNPA